MYTRRSMVWRIMGKMTEDGRQVWTDGAELRAVSDSWSRGRVIRADEVGEWRRG
jgi:hypothetical protein